ncbi:MAG: metal-dependent hydrolase [Halobacteriota archaeon]
MNKRDHVLNAVALAIGMGAILAPSFDEVTARTVAMVGLPVLLGAMVPDIDTSIGSHRKTFHNFLTLGAFAVFPFVFGNLHFVWIGVATHYVLDLLGNVRGMALFYPWPEEYDVPVGVTVDSRWATVVTMAVTAFELGIFYLLVAAPDVGQSPWLVGLFPV